MLQKRNLKNAFTKCAPHAFTDTIIFLTCSKILQNLTCRVLLKEKEPWNEQKQFSKIHYTRWTNEKFITNPSKSTFSIQHQTIRPLWISIIGIILKIEAKKSKCKDIDFSIKANLQFNIGNHCFSRFKNRNRRIFRDIPFLVGTARKFAKSVLLELTADGVAMLFDDNMRADFHSWNTSPLDDGSELLLIPLR